MSYLSRVLELARPVDVQAPTPQQMELPAMMIGRSAPAGADDRPVSAQDWLHLAASSAPPSPHTEPARHEEADRGPAPEPTIDRDQTPMVEGSTRDSTAPAPESTSLERRDAPEEAEQHHVSEPRPLVIEETRRPALVEGHPAPLGELVGDETDAKPASSRVVHEPHPELPQRPNRTAHIEHETLTEPSPQAQWLEPAPVEKKPQRLERPPDPSMPARMTPMRGNVPSDRGLTIGLIEVHVEAPASPEPEPAEPVRRPRPIVSSDAGTHLSLERHSIRM